MLRDQRLRPNSRRHHACIPGSGPGEGNGSTSGPGEGDGSGSGTGPGELGGTGSGSGRTPGYPGMGSGARRIGISQRWATELYRLHMPSASAANACYGDVQFRGRKADCPENGYVRSPALPWPSSYLYRARKRALKEFGQTEPAVLPVRQSA
jgi:hypothetical protein